MYLSNRFFDIVLRTTVGAACLFGIWESWKIARADYLFRQDTPQALRSAIRLAPDASAYYMRLAQLDESDAKVLLETALRLDRFNAQADIELGLWYEAEGNPGRAEQLLLQAFQVDHTYLPRWSLANFYLRRDNLPAFWTWAHSAAEMPSDDIGALFALCWRVSPDPQLIEDRILNGNPQIDREFTYFLLEKNEFRAAANAAMRLIRGGTVGMNRSLFFNVINRLVAANDGTDSAALWQQLVQKNLVVSDGILPNNRAFARDPQPVSFDWALPSYSGLHSWPGPSGLEIEFMPEEPESCTIAEQALILNPGEYTFDYSYRTSDIPPDTGIKWQIIDGKSGKAISSSSDLSSDTMRQQSMQFAVDPGNPVLLLRLSYNRALGTTHISGRLRIASTQIRLSPAK